MADDPKLAEFRDKNISLMKEIDDLKAKYKDIDPDAIAADRLKLTDYQTAKTQLDAARVELATEKAALAAEKTAHADTRKRADDLVIESAITDLFSKNGGRPEARAFVVAQAAGQFVVKNGQVIGTKFSPDRAGEPMSVTEWITLQTRQNAFCFFNSSGGGADPKAGGGSGGAKVLRNPSPQELGRYGKEIANGTMRIEYE